MKKAIQVLCAAIISTVSCAAVQAEKPNVLFISIDDLNDWVSGLNGHPQTVTPHMDQLFAQGLLFTNAHCSQAVCTASRNSLLSGLHPSSTGYYSSTSAMRRSFATVMGDHRMLPQYFKDNGFKTLAVGKIFHTGVSDYKTNGNPTNWTEELSPGWKMIPFRPGCSRV